MAPFLSLSRSLSHLYTILSSSLFFLKAKDARRLQVAYTEARESVNTLRSALEAEKAAHAKTTAQVRYMRVHTYHISISMNHFVYNRFNIYISLCNILHPF